MKKNKNSNKKIANHPITYILLLLSCLLLSIITQSCNKQNEWLDIKPNKSDVTPSTIENYQALLDASDGPLNSSTPGIGLVGMDNYYITSATYNAAGTFAERNGHIWAADIWQGANASDWNDMYAAIAVTNIVLDGIKSIPRTTNNASAFDNVQGSAYFHRAFCYYQLAQLFMKPYDPATANSDPGLPLRINSDINSIVQRSSVSDTYDQMTNDLQAAESLVPDRPVYQTRPSKQAVYGLLAKIYLHKGNYTLAALNANKSLLISEKLVDFNTLSTSATKPMPVFPTHPEIFFYTTATNYGILSPSSSRCIVDSELIKSYAANDLRKTLFFTTPNATGQSFFKGQYSGSNSAFSGLANNEMLLIFAESQARLQQVTEAMATLNKLLIKRWKTGTFVSLTATSAQDALKKIVDEKRKELPFTGSNRWEELRRLNREPVFAKTLIRNVNNLSYQLAPNDIRYTLPIPDQEIRLTGMVQNPR